MAVVYTDSKTVALSKDFTLDTFFKRLQFRPMKGQTATVLRLKQKLCKLGLTCMPTNPDTPAPPHQPGAELQMETR